MKRLFRKAAQGGILFLRESGGGKEVSSGIEHMSAIYTAMSFVRQSFEGGK